MKKIIIFLLITSLAMPLTACADNKSEATTQNTHADDLTALAEGVMTYEQFVLSDEGAAIVMETCVEKKQSWEDSRAVISTLDENGTDISCEVTCSKEAYEELASGTKVILFGYKGDINGEAGIIDATFEISE